MECKLSADDAFGPAVHGCRNNFDFTLLFEQSFFQLVPSALFLLAFPLRTLQLRRQNVKTLRSGIRALKQFSITILAGTQLGLLVLWSTVPGYRTKVSIPAATLSLLASVVLLVLSSMEHTRSVRPSSIINSYILFSLLLDIPQARTLWLREGPRALGGVFTAGIAAKAVVLFLEALSKRRSLLPPYRLYAPESLVSWYDRAVLWWLNPLLIQGYKGFLSFERLQNIDGMSSEEVEATFRQAWEKWRDRRCKLPLLWALVDSMKGTLLALVVPRLFLSGFRLCQPLLINRITSLLSDKRTLRTENFGRGLIGATVLIYLGLAVSNAIYKRQLHRLVTKIRGSLVTAVFGKALVSASDKISDNAALTLMTADVRRVCASFEQIDELFATPIEVGVAVFLLERQTGVSCVAPVALSIFISVTSFFNSNKTGRMQKTWLASVQERVAYTASILGSPKGFKMLGLTDYLTDRIQALRLKELAEYAHYRRYVVHRNCLANIPIAFGPPLTLIMFTLINGGASLTPTVAFTALSLVTLLTEPIHELIHAVPLFQIGLASLDRLQTFLLLKTEIAAIAQAENEDNASKISNAEYNGAIELDTMKTADTNIQTNPTRPVLSVSKGSVRLGKDNSLILRDIDIKIFAGTLTFLIGPVGCGKSVLLKTIMGEIHLNLGRRHDMISDGFAYCAQEPWLPNETVRNLIIGQSELDAVWFSTVVHACALSADIGSLPLGDETIIGTKGVSLSGGQRQRMALARALYARKKILFIDDVLSGLDPNTSKMVFDNVFGVTGLCKRYRLTVIMATHSVQHLSEADQIIALGETGRVVEQGSFQELNARNGYVHNLSLKGTTSKASEEAEIQEPLQPATETNKLAEAQEDLTRKTGDISVYRYYAKSIGWFYGSIIVSTSAIHGFCEVFPGLWVRLWSEAEASGNPRYPLGLWIGIYILIGIIGLITVFTNIWMMLVISVPKSSAQLHKQLLRTVMEAPYSFFVKTDAGVTLNRFSNDMNLIETFLAGAVMQTLTGAFICMTSAALIATGARYVGVVMPFVLLVLYGIQKFYLRTSRQLRFMDLESQAPLLTHYSETLSGVTTIRAFGWQTQFHKKCLVLLDNSQRPHYLLFCIQRWLNLVLDLTTAGIAIVVVSMAVTLSETSSAGSVGVSLLNILSFNSQLSWLITAWTTLETSLGAVARCKNFEKSTSSENQPSETQAPPSDWPQTGQLVLKDVSASYNEDGENVLKDISLSISCGEKIGICGRSGSGKSSLLLTILRLLDNNFGSITLDDINLATIPRQTIRERLTALPQEVITFPGSLKENIDPLQRSSDVELNSALQKIGLADLIEQRGGLEAKMSDLSLSQGQLQLFAVARALLRKSKFVVLDEMTSSVDAVTESTMLSVVREEFAESTVIAIAHRLKTIVDFDRIVVMDKGRIVETGRPSHLLEKEDGYLRAMWERSGH